MSEQLQIAAFLMLPDCYDPYVSISRDWSCDHVEPLVTAASANAALAVKEARIVELEAMLSRVATTNAARDVLNERRRQVESEGRTPELDDEYDAYQLAEAAGCYALNSMAPGGMHIWPWDKSWWKRAPHRRQMVKAGALILAEIERVDREDMKAEKVNE